MAEPNCLMIQELLNDYVDDLLSPEENAMVAHHVETCTECKKELESIKELLSLIHNMPEQPLPDNFDDKLHLALIAASTEVDTEDNAVIPIVLTKKSTKTPIWQRSWFPRSMAASIVLLFGIVSISYANPGALDFGLQGAMDDSASENSSYQMADISNDATLKAASDEVVDSNKVVDNGSKSVGSGTAKPKAVLASDKKVNTNDTANAIIAGSDACTASRGLASRDDDYTHNSLPLLPTDIDANANVVKADATTTALTDTDAGSSEAADKNYYWQDYGYAKLNLTVKDSADTLSQAADVATDVKGSVCDEFFDYNEDKTLTKDNSIMLDVPVDTFDDTIKNLSSLGDVKSCTIPDTSDTDGSKFYTFDSGGITYRSVVVIVEQSK